MTETIPWPIQNAAEWMPLWKGAGFFLATFVLEDAAAIGAGLLLAAGAISWPVAFGACFLGIWSGDAGLYALARFGGRPWLERSRLKKFSPGSHAVKSGLPPAARGSWFSAAVCPARDCRPIWPPVFCVCHFRDFFGSPARPPWSGPW